VVGDVHSNSSLKITGSQNDVDGSVTYRCDVHLGGKDNVFTTGPQQVAEPQPWPVWFTASDFICTYTVAGSFDINKAGPWWVGGTSASKQLNPGVYCGATITLSVSNVTGTVTFVAGSIQISGAGQQLAAYQHGVLLFATGMGNNGIMISGSGGQWSGVLFAPESEIDLSGANQKVVGGSVVGFTVKLTGSNWLIDSSIATEQDIGVLPTSIH
jgi:hypothetical protein